MKKNERETNTMSRPETAAEPKEEVRFIVRLAGKDLDGKKPIYHALTGIRGIGQRYGLIVAKVFERKTGVPTDARIGTVSEEQEKLLEKILLQPEEFGIPTWALNRRKDFYTGKDSQAIMGDLEFAVRQDVQRLNRIKTYRGLRHSWGLPVRGQRTRSTHRGKGPVVGVQKKDAVKAAAPAAGKGEEKKDKK